MAKSGDQADLFKQSFKFYKRKVPRPDFSEVVEFDTCKEAFLLSVKAPSIPRICGIIPPERWKVYGLPKLPGFYIIKNPFTADGHKYWTYRSLHDFPCKPNVCNLDAHMTRDESENIWEVSQRKDRCSKNTLLGRLRWVTLGYHHNWDTKKYLRDNHTAFPEDLGYLSRYIVSALDLSQSYRAEAAIINYYHTDSTLAGHTDHSEFDLQAPLISVSFGLPAVFLLGGVTKETSPVAMWLRSGDVVVMSGESRLAYHAIPRIVAPSGEELQNCGSPCDSEPAKCNNTDGVNQSLSRVSGRADTREELDPGPMRKHVKLCVSGTAVDTSFNMSHESELGDASVPCTDSSHSTTLSSAPCEYVESKKGQGDCSSSGSMDHQKLHTDLSQGSENCHPVSKLGDDEDHAVTNINCSIRQALDCVDFTLFMDYIKTSRINMNVRQVFKSNQTPDDAFSNDESSELQNIT